MAAIQQLIGEVRLLIGKADEIILEHPLRPFFKHKIVIPLKYFGICKINISIPKSQREKSFRHQGKNRIRH